MDKLTETERKFRGIGINSIPHVKGHHCTDYPEKYGKDKRGNDLFRCAKCGKLLAHYLGGR